MNARTRNQIESRLLNLQEAAIYCGLPTRGFKKNVPVKPIRLGPHELWDKAKLDAYIDALQGERQAGKEDWGAAVAFLCAVAAGAIR